MVLLQRTGEALFGPRWQADLSRALDVSDRTVRRWVNGDERLPSGVAMDLWRLCEERILALDGLVEDLKIAATPR